MSEKKKYLYLFSEGNKDMREILGGKGANLAEMTNAGMPVPQGFTISTEACTQYYNDGRKINDEIMADIYEYIGKLEEIAGSYEGVEKAYAIQAGREIRVIVKPEVLDDEKMVVTAREMAKRIESELSYPGQIKINLIRESRVTDYAK